jgi:glutathione S-transferase
MMKVYGRSNSINVMKVMWCSAELGLEVERIDLGGPFGGNDAPAYRKKNPNGKVPTLEDGDFILWESNAILRYLVEAHGGEPWLPGDVQSRGLAHQWTEWSTTEVAPQMFVIFWQLVRTVVEKREMAKVEQALLTVAPIWGILDSHLLDRAYVLGDSPSMADIPLGAYAYRWFEMPIERPRLANLEAWYERLKERPAFREHVLLPLS